MSIFSRMVSGLTSLWREKAEPAYVISYKDTELLMDLTNSIPAPFEVIELDDEDVKLPVRLDEYLNDVCSLMPELSAVCSNIRGEVKTSAAPVKLSPERSDVVGRLLQRLYNEFDCPHELAAFFDDQVPEALKKIVFTGGEYSWETPSIMLTRAKNELVFNGSERRDAENVVSIVNGEPYREVA